MHVLVIENRVRDSVPVPDWHRTFLARVLPAVETQAYLRFRHLPPGERDEAKAESIARAVVTYVRLIRRGKARAHFAGRLARFSVLNVLEGRLTASPDNGSDVLSRYARQRRKFEVESLDAGQARFPSWESVLVENRNITPADLAASRIDFREWLGRMKRRRRQIAQTLAAGYGTGEVAAIFQLSAGRISQLRREFEASWRRFQEGAV
jgi:hypothetical protein